MHVISTTRRGAGQVIEEVRVNRTSLHRIRPAPQRILLILGSTRPGTLFVDGHELASNCCVIVDEGAEAELIAHPGSAWLALSLNSGLAGRLPLVSTRRTIPLRSGVRLVLPPRHAPHCGGGEDALARATHVFRCTEDQIADVANSDAANDKRKRRHLAVERAREYIRRHLADPIRLADLCAHAQLRARSLEYGFREVVRSSPMGYLRMVRLGEVRTLLLGGAATTRNISAIALDTGFSHVSQFVADYKKMFGETPSTTRRNALRHGINPHRPQPSSRALVAMSPPAHFAQAISASAPG